MILQTTRSHYIVTDAAFRELGSDISDMLASIGLVKVPFAGQIDWSTVVKPTAARTDAGFEVWRFNDSMQETAPVYLRVGYGTGYYDSDFGLTVALATEVTAAGELAGTKTEAIPRRTYNAGPYYSYKTSVVGDASRLLIHCYLGSVYNVMAIERMAGTDGLPGPDGAVVLSTHNESDNVYILAALQRSPAATAYYNSGSVGLLGSLPPGASAASGTDIALGPLRTWVDRRETRPLHSVLTYCQPDLTADNPVRVTCWDGRTRTYLPLSSNLNYIAGAQSNSYLAYLWE